jgi:hypothetical protein
LQQRLGVRVPKLADDGRSDKFMTNLSSYFQFEDTFYQQKEGMTMGNSLSPAVSNIFMEHFEEIALKIPKKDDGRVERIQLRVENPAVKRRLYVCCSGVIFGLCDVVTLLHFLC